MGHVKFWAPQGSLKDGSSNEGEPQQRSTAGRPGRRIDEDGEGGEGMVGREGAGRTVEG